MWLPCRSTARRSRYRSSLWPIDRLEKLQVPVIRTRPSFTRAEPTRDGAMRSAFWVGLNAIFVIASTSAIAAEPDHSSPLPKAFVDGTGPGWSVFGENELVAVNGAADTWRWKDGVLHCTGSPKGVLRSHKE